MPRRSAGILLYRDGVGGTEILLVHPGGPFWAKKDAGAWSIPKGDYGEGDDPRACALREFDEELGSPLLVQKSPRDVQRARILIDFIKWALTDGQKFATQLGYAPLPQEVVALELEALQ